LSTGRYTSAGASAARELGSVRPSSPCQ
jgi:hypothetical protein